MKDGNRKTDMQAVTETDMEIEANDTEPKDPEATADQRIEKYCADIKAAHVRSVEGVIQMGNIITQAKDELGDTFNKLQERLKEVIGYSSTVLSNLTTIAKKEALADSAHWCRLPTGYNTLYQLALVEDSKLAEAIANGVVNPGMTLAEAKALRTVVPFTQKKGTASSDIPVILSLSGADRQPELLAKLDALLREYGGQIKDADKNGLLARCRRESLVKDALAQIEATKDGLSRYTLEEMRLAESAAGYFMSPDGKVKGATLPTRYKDIDFKPLITEVGAINSSVPKKELSSWVKEKKMPNQLSKLARVQDMVYVWEQARLVAEKIDETGAIKRLRKLVDADNPLIAATAEDVLERIYGFLPKEAAKGKKVTEDSERSAAA